jgi:hypothetical protein
MDAETRFHAFGSKSIWSTDTWSTEHKKKIVDEIYVTKKQIYDNNFRSFIDIRFYANLKSACASLHF